MTASAHLRSVGLNGKSSYGRDSISTESVAKVLVERDDTGYLLARSGPVDAHVTPLSGVRTTGYGHSAAASFAEGKADKIRTGRYKETARQLLGAKENHDHDCFIVGPGVPISTDRIAIDTPCDCQASRLSYVDVGSRNDRFGRRKRFDGETAIVEPDTCARSVCGVQLNSNPCFTSQARAPSGWARNS